MRKRDSGMLARLRRLVRALLGRFVDGLAKPNAAALLDDERRRLRETIRVYNRHLAQQAELLERLRTQTATLRAQVAELTASTTARLQAGDHDVAANLALDLRHVREHLHENERQEQDAAELYRRYLRQRDVVIREVGDKIDALARQLSTVELMEAHAELSVMVAPGAVTAEQTTSGLRQMEESLQGRYARAAGTVRVARDLASGDHAGSRDADRRVRAEEALAEFLANTDVEPAPTPDAPVTSAGGSDVKTR